ncbi:hypothetical protein ACWY4P_40975 [Streptomyces sp. LZ34]
MPVTFRCGHPRTPENSAPNGRNCPPLCGTCNTKKATKTVDYRPALAAV